MTDATFEPGEVPRHRPRPGQPPAELLKPAGRPANPSAARPDLQLASRRQTAWPDMTIRPASGAVVEPAQLRWVPPEVLAACTAAMRRIDVDAVHAVAVPSAASGEGRTTMSLGTALVQRNQYGRRTILLELDFEAPSFAALLGLEPVAGLAEVLRGKADLEGCIVWPDPHLGVLVAGDVDGDAVSLMSRFRTSPVLTDLRSAGYAVVADLPPLPPEGLADRVVDIFASVLLVVRAGATSVDAVRVAVDALTEPPLVILNRTRSAIPKWLRKTWGR